LEPAPELVSLPRSFYLRPTTEVARDLLGRYLVLEHPGQAPKIGRVVETEAYLGEADRACHAFHGRTRRTAPMYEEAGHAYVYFVYGMYWCLNVVTEDVGRPYAVLLRAAEPVAGIERPADGPGKLCKAFGLNGEWNRVDLTAGNLRITDGRPASSSEVAVSPRIGVAYAGEWAERPLRFYISSSSHVSKSRQAGRRRPVPSVARGLAPRP
jgi:DNA-3-methyladenine glycosylase